MSNLIKQNVLFLLMRYEQKNNKISILINFGKYDVIFIVDKLINVTTLRIAGNLKFPSGVCYRGFIM